MLREWKGRHPDEVIGYPSENQNRLWAWRGGYYEIDRLVIELYAWEGVEPR